MTKTLSDKIEYLILLISEFAARTKMTEAQAYQILRDSGAFALCDKHYGIMHTLSVEDNIETLLSYCRRKGVNV